MLKPGLEWEYMLTDSVSLYFSRAILWLSALKKHGGKQGLRSYMWIKLEKAPRLARHLLGPGL
jgi:hypothetical protein